MSTVEKKNFRMKKIYYVREKSFHFNYTADIFYLKAAAIFRIFVIKKSEKGINIERIEKQSNCRMHLF